MVSGAPAFDHKQWLRAVGVFSRLPELAKAIRKLQAQIPADGDAEKDLP